MALSERQKQRRERLWKEDPRCRKCKKETILITSIMPPNLTVRERAHFMKGMAPETMKKLATLQHERSRLHPDRLKSSKGWTTTTLWCWDCNTNDGNEEYSALPIEEQRRRAQQGHYA